MQLYHEKIYQSHIIGIKQEGGAIYVVLPNNPIEEYNLYEIPQYGGESMFIGKFKTFGEAIEKGKTLT